MLVDIKYSQLPHHRHFPSSFLGEGELGNGEKESGPTIRSYLMR